MTSSQTLSAPTQLLLRSQLFERFDSTSQPLLVVNAPDAGLLHAAPKPELLHSWHVHAGFAAQWPAAQRLFSGDFAADPTPLGTTSQQPLSLTAVLYLPKEKILTHYLLSQLAAVMASAAAPVHLYIVGEKRGGIKSLPKLLQGQAAWSAPLKLSDGHHSSLFVTTLNVDQVVPAKPLSEQASWFEYHYALGNAPAQRLQLCTYPGVFAHASVDSGSNFLLKHLQLWPRARTVLDFACGAGVLGACLQQTARATGRELAVSYLDVNALALAATEATLAAHDLVPAKIIAADHLPADIGRFDTIVSHPPFHTGIATDYAIGQQFLQQARQHLTASGELWLVANKFLPWPEMIEQAFGHCEVRATDNRYAVYFARQRRS